MKMVLIMKIVIKSNCQHYVGFESFCNMTGWMLARSFDCAIVAMHERDKINFKYIRVMM